jgi:hypothetical protein
MLAHRVLDEWLQDRDEGGQPRGDAVQVRIVERLDRQHLVDPRPAAVPLLGLDPLGELSLGDQDVLFEISAQPLVRRGIGFEVEADFDPVDAPMEPDLVVDAR